jgi:6-phosphogluconolactonase/glucosamine-6-phosphate isomerase/deaminase
MQFLKINSGQSVAEYISDIISEKLEQGKKVLWLVPGGSSIVVATQASSGLKGRNLSNLRVTLTDERYGPVGHKDSNWKQLLNAGFALSGAKLNPVLSGKGIEETSKAFDQFLISELVSVNYRIGFFGIGADGHTAGILPGSPALSASTFASFYQASEFIRITMTPRAIEKLDEAVVYAVGQPKWPILDQLEQEVTLNEQPAQILKKVPKLTVFNDYKGENI